MRIYGETSFSKMANLTKKKVDTKGFCRICRILWRALYVLMEQKRGLTLESNE